MTVRPQPREAKRLVVRTFLDFGAASPSLFGVKETILANNDRCIARTYQVADMRAVWCVEDGTVRFYDVEGCLLRVVNLLAERTPQLMVA
jgi:hypothetical protein